jgi:hypothetical protein
MAIFTAIATFAVTAYTGAAIVAGTWAAFAVSVVATGLAMVTSRLINGSGRGGGGGGNQDQGVRIQLPPATENKVPVVYGRAFQQAVVTDAVLTTITDTNDTMTYVLTLSEKTSTSTFTCGGVYWNDQKLIFGADGYTVESSIPADGSTSTVLAGLVKVWMFDGNSTNNISIDGGAVPTDNAYDLMNTTSTYNMSDLIFAVVRLTYTPDKGVTGLPTMSFDITNSISNPADVWYDYMRSERYGGGFSDSDLDLTSVSRMRTLSNTVPPNQFQNNGSTPLTQPRYQINGVINTGDTLKNNLDRINVSSASWTTFDHKSGKWKIIANTTGTAVMNFNDDNIIGEITLTATNLEDLFNSAEVAYANRGTKDQTDYYKVEIDPTQMNDLEPVNIMRMRAEMVNNKVHAGRIGNIELQQSRLDLVITFTADYSALQVEAGDIISVTNPIYDFNSKLFRVTRVRETEGEDGSLAAEISALEYSAAVYDDLVLNDGDTKPVSGIPVYGNIPAPSAPIPGIVSTATDVFSLTTTIAPTSGSVDQLQWFFSTSSSTGFVYLTNEIPGVGYYNAGQTIVDSNVSIATANTYYFKCRAGQGSRFSDLSAVSSPGFYWNPADYGPI